MKRGFFIKMALGNVKKNYRFFIPRILAEAGLLACFYIALTLAMDGRLAEVKGGAYIPTFMWIGVAVLAILSTVLMFYTNSFLMKQRKMEFGLYNVLGMEKRHVGRILFHETAVCALISIIGGLGLGMLFYKLCSLLICNLLDAEIVIGFYFITPKTLAPAGAFFAVLDLVTYLVNRIVIHRMKPVDLLKSRSTGEKEPRVKWVMLVAGILSLAGGYVISITTESPLKALTLFFLAVVLVIIGTYFLFVTGSTFVLKALKKNKRYYYNKKHMPAVSGLLYRMKQNAVGLASIAILATGVLVMISTTVSLYSGNQDVLDACYPQDMYISVNYYTEDGTPVPVPTDVISDAVRASSEKYGLSVRDISCDDYLSVSYYVDNQTLYAESETNVIDPTAGLSNFVFITQKQYEDLTGQSLGLSGNQIAVAPLSLPNGDIDRLTGKITVHALEYAIVKELTYFPIRSPLIVYPFPAYGIVMADDGALETLYGNQRRAYGDNASEMASRVNVTYADRKAASDVGNQLTVDISHRIEAYIENQPDYLTGWHSDIDSYWETRESFFGMYGVLLFLGMLLGAVCLFATVLIIYYKQISEGYEDRERFQIMQKIGMSQAEVKKTVNGQVLFVFFLPLLVAGVHLAFASPILLRLLRVLLLSDTGLFILCSCVTYVVFALVYVLIYAGTSKTYYKIVH